MLNIGIEHLCVFGLPPLAYVELVASLDCTAISMRLSRPEVNPHGYPDWSLRDDAGLRRDTRVALRDSGVELRLCEGFAVLPGQDATRYAADLDIVAELGAPRINVASLATDLAETRDQLATIVGLARERGIAVTVEVGSGPLARFDVVSALVREFDRADVRIMVDAMHFFRFGGQPEILRGPAAPLIGYAQLCDAPWQSRFERYMDEAMFERLPPGEGELPLLDFLVALPRDIPLALEIPQRGLAEAGVGPRERLQRCVDATRALLRRRDAS